MKLMKIGLEINENNSFSEEHFSDMHYPYLVL
jgi:hypothetical protein